MKDELRKGNIFLFPAVKIVKSYGSCEEKWSSSRPFIVYLMQRLSWIWILYVLYGVTDHKTRTDFVALINSPTCSIAGICVLIPATPFGRIFGNSTSVTFHLTTRIWIFWLFSVKSALNIWVFVFPCIFWNCLKLNFIPVGSGTAAFLKGSALSLKLF